MNLTERQAATIRSMGRMLVYIPTLLFFLAVAVFVVYSALMYGGAL